MNTGSGAADAKAIELIEIDHTVSFAYVPHPTPHIHPPHTYKHKNELGQNENKKKSSNKKKKRYVKQSMKIQNLVVHALN